MDYIELPDLQNTYPTFEKYEPSGQYKATLFGVYPDKNKIEFTIPQLLEKVEVVRGTTFRFIIEVRIDDNDKNPKYFTSRTFYRDLKDALNVGNPYLPLSALSDKFLLRLNVKDALDLVLKLKEPEENDLVFVTKNIFIENTSDTKSVTQINETRKAELQQQLADEIAKLESLRINTNDNTFGRLNRADANGDIIPNNTLEVRRAISQQEKKVKDIQTEIANLSNTNQLNTSLLNSQKQVNYELLVKYIDWITLPNDYDIDTVETGGVLEANKIGAWEGEFITGSVIFGQTQKNESVQNSVSTLQSQLVDVNNTIQQIETELKNGNFNNIKLFEALGLVSLFPIGLLTLFSKKKRKEEAIAKLNDRLREFKEKKASLEKQIKDLKGG